MTIIEKIYNFCIGKDVLETSMTPVDKSSPLEANELNFIHYCEMDGKVKILIDYECNEIGRELYGVQQPLFNTTYLELLRLSQKVGKALAEVEVGFNV